MQEINNEVWQQFENIRASGETNMMDKVGVCEAAIKRKYMELAEVCQENRLVELVSGYSHALKNNKFTRRTK